MQVFCNQSGGKYDDGRGKVVSREIVAIWQDYLLELAWRVEMMCLDF